MDSSTTEVLFNRGVPVTIKQHILASHALPSRTPIAGGFSEQFQEKRHPCINVHVGLTTKNSGRLKALEVQLTDETDPFFLHQLEVGEDDFHILKEEQNLLVDFQQFPLKFIELLEACVASGKEEQAKFVAQLTTHNSENFTSFEIVETNTFRNITHISLRFVPGNDTAVKQYLAQLVKDHKKEIIALRSQLNSTGSSLSARVDDAEATIVKLNTELEKARRASVDDMNRLKVHHAEELARERETLMRKREEERLSAEREKRDIEVTYEEKLRTMSLELSSLKTSHSHLLAHSQSVEASAMGANKQIESLRGEVASLRHGLDKQITKAESAEQNASDLEAQCHSLKDKVRNLEQLERSKAGEERRLSDLLQAATEQKAKADDAVEVYKAQNARLEDGLKQATDEINKGNDIIRRLQSDHKSLKAKFKLKNVVTLQQEKLLDERASTIQSLQKEVIELKDKVAKSTDELQTAQARIEELLKQLNEAKGLIEDNNHVIEYLHKQMNEDALSRPLGGFAAAGGMPYSATTTADTAIKRASPTGYRSRYLATAVRQDETSPIRP
ncbi:Spindle assembly abnormal protein 6 [Gaertneriomyces sp. JEL0708]|nr:Spindle assembly abnormal protein 6 [Gaertneriomyces sp. JEL0708]